MYIKSSQTAKPLLLVDYFRVCSMLQKLSPTSLQHNHSSLTDKEKAGGGRQWHLLRSMSWYALSAMEKMWGGASERRLPLYAATTSDL